MALDNNEKQGKSCPVEPVGPFHGQEGQEIWIAEKCLNVYEWHEKEYDSTKTPSFFKTGKLFTIVTTASLNKFTLREPLAEVIERLGWKADKAGPAKET